ncbi:MAG: thioredoxin domain-containing protein, partial [Anaerolineales bacterium]|nr:thioredoxin domain-containing protein [Anaerolineales bacterium]
HFEKMLYDNAQLARVYLHAWQATGSTFFRVIAEETLDYVVREMQGPEGGVYSTQDADSEGEEGRFYVWTESEIRDALGGEADDFTDVYGVKPGGNWEAKSILELTGTLEQRERLADARAALSGARELRVRPDRDDKVLTAWNGLMLAALAEAARALDRGDYRRAAERAAEFLLRDLRQANGRLLRTWRDGKAKLNAYLEDYACLIDGLLELYQTTFDARWFVAARELADTMIEHFGAADGGFYDTSDDHEALITRLRDLQDNAMPSGSAMAATVLLKLSGLVGDLRYADIAHQMLVQMQPALAQYPLAFSQWLQAFSYALAEPWEVAIVGDPVDASTRALLAVSREGYRPFQVVACGAPGQEVVPLLRDRGLVDGRAAAYVCRSEVCQAPVTEAEELKAQLQCT